MSVLVLPFHTTRLPQKCNFAPPPFGLLVLPDLGHPTICPESLYYHRALGHSLQPPWLERFQAQHLVGWLGLGIQYLCVCSLSVHIYFSGFQLSIKKITWKKCRPFSMRIILQSIDVVWKERENGKARNNNVSYLDTTVYSMNMMRIQTPLDSKPTQT